MSERVVRRLAKPDSLIVNSPYREPERYWKYDREKKEFLLIEGERRPAGYLQATPDSAAHDDPGIFRELPLVNIIRRRVNEWRAAEYPGVTATTRRLLDHWHNTDERQYPFFYCQLEAIETLIWLVEASPADVQGVHVPGDGGPFARYCTKLATGGGKTIVMAMAIAWQVCNKVAARQDARFAKHVLVVAPGLTVRNRLSVLKPDHPDGDYFKEFGIVPGGSMMDALRQGSVGVLNWHKLDWESDEQIAKRRGVDKRGAKSDEAYVRGVLREAGLPEGARNILVLNDEAHHAWRVPEGKKIPGVSRADAEEATKWVGGLDRVHKARGVLRCFDCSATPFVPTGKKSGDEQLFGWIVSDFGLNDAIESGLVKTPRIVVRDDAVPDVKTYKPKLYHIYPHVKDDLNGKREPHEPLPSLVTGAYYLLGRDWLATKEAWEKQGHEVPPVMISVANRTETAARIKYAFDHGNILIEELCDPERTLHIDSKVLESAEGQDEPVELDAAADDDDDGADDGPIRKLTKKEMGELLRRQVDTVGKAGEPGGPIQNVISVAMLTEGWDARTVTHIMGLRAFSSQLLCEQVIGRGLRRTSYDDFDGELYRPEYVNVFGIPFSFMPHEGGDAKPPPPPPPRTEIKPLQEREAEFEITWPQVLKIEVEYRPRLDLDWSKVPELELHASDIPQLAEIAPTV
ncbi:MAG: DEAD/DEAH box helicase, partial [Phycisphaerales bacterium JB041]